MIGYWQASPALHHAAAAARSNAGDLLTWVIIILVVIVVVAVILVTEHVTYRGPLPRGAHAKPPGRAHAPAPPAGGPPWPLAAPVAEYLDQAGMYGLAEDRDGDDTVEWLREVRPEPPLDPLPPHVAVHAAPDVPQAVECDPDPAYDRLYHDEFSPQPNGEPGSATHLLDGIDRHFAAGLPSLSTPQLAEHEATGACTACREPELDLEALETGTIVPGPGPDGWREIPAAAPEGCELCGSRGHRTDGHDALAASLAQVMLLSRMATQPVHAELTAPALPHLEAAWADDTGSFRAIAAVPSAEASDALDGLSVDEWLEARFGAMTS